MIETRIVFSGIPLEVQDGRPDEGAEIVFRGCVRGEEGGRPILALEYEQYEGMAEAELRKLALETARRFAVTTFSCAHRVGRVPVGEASVQVVIRSVHRKEALAAMAFFLDELKARVPIWKWGVTPEGERFPSRAAGS